MAETYEGILNKKLLKPSQKGEFYLLTVDQEVFFANKSISDVPMLGTQVKITYETRGKDAKGRPYRWLSGIQKTGIQETITEAPIETVNEPEEETRVEAIKRTNVQTYDNVLTQAMLNATGVVGKSLLVRKALDSATSMYSTLTSEQKSSITMKDLLLVYVDLYSRIGISMAISYERNGGY